MTILISESATFSKGRRGKETGQLMPRGTMHDFMQLEPVVIVILLAREEKKDNPCHGVPSLCHTLPEAIPITSHLFLPAS